jgi:hypothetical protein
MRKSLTISGLKAVEQPRPTTEPKTEPDPREPTILAGDARPIEDSERTLDLSRLIAADLLDCGTSMCDYACQLGLQQKRPSQTRWHSPKPGLAPTA